MPKRTSKYVDWVNITRHDSPDKRQRLHDYQIRESLAIQLNDSPNSGDSQILDQPEMESDQTCLHASVLSRATICSEVVLDITYDIFGNLVNRTGEKYYNIMFQNGDTEWVRSDYCSDVLIREYEHFKSISMNDCGSNHGCTLDGQLCQRHIDEALHCVTLG